MLSSLSSSVTPSASIAFFILSINLSKFISLILPENLILGADFS
jgi:hypothetical protein